MSDPGQRPADLRGVKDRLRGGPGGSPPRERITGSGEIGRRPTSSLSPGMACGAQPRIGGSGGSPPRASIADCGEIARRPMSSLTGDMPCGAQPRIGGSGGSPPRASIADCGEIARRPMSMHEQDPPFPPHGTGLKGCRCRPRYQDTCPGSRRQRVSGVSDSGGSHRLGLFMRESRVGRTAEPRSLRGFSASSPESSPRRFPGGPSGDPPGVPAASGRAPRCRLPPSRSPRTAPAFTVRDPRGILGING